MAVMEAPETIDMMICLKEIATVLQVPAENVAKVPIQESSLFYSLTLTSSLAWLLDLVS
jgi:hypothetical protein